MDIKEIEQQITDIKVKDRKVNKDEVMLNGGLPIIKIFCEIIPYATLGNRKPKKQKGLLFIKEKYSLKELDCWVSKNCPVGISKEVNTTENYIKVVYDHGEEIYTMQEGIIKKGIIGTDNTNKILREYMKDVYRILEQHFTVVSISTYGNYNYGTIVKANQDNFDLRVYVFENIEQIKITVGNKKIIINSIQNFLTNLCQMGLPEVQILYAKYKLINPKFKEVLRPIYANKDELLRNNFKKYLINIKVRIEKDLSKLEMTQRYNENIINFMRAKRLTNYLEVLNGYNTGESFNDTTRASYYARLERAAFTEESLALSTSKLSARYQKALKRVKTLKIPGANTNNIDIIEEVNKKILSLDINKKF